MRIDRGHRIRRWFLSAVALTALLASNAQVVPATVPAWEVVPARNTGPTFIGSHQMVAIEQSLYVFGGFLEDLFNGQNTFYREMWRFNTKTNEWTLLSAAGPSARAFHGMAADENAQSIYVYGGASFNADFSGVSLFDDLWRFDTRNSRWTRLDPVGAEKPSALAGHQIAIIGRRLYLFGGAFNQFFFATNQLWVYNINTNKWKQLRNESSPNNAPVRFEFVMQEAKIGDDKGLLIAKGEFLNPATFQFEQRLDTWFYSIANDSLIDVTPPSAHNGDILAGTNAQAVVQGNVLVHGGDLPGGEAGCGSPFPQNVSDETWRFDLETLRWSRLATENTPMPLKRPAGARIGHHFYVQGGFDFNCVDESLPAQTWNNALYRIKPFDR